MNVLIAAQANPAGCCGGMTPYHLPASVATDFAAIRVLATSKVHVSVTSDGHREREKGTTSRSGSGPREEKATRKGDPMLSVLPCAFSRDVGNSQQPYVKDDGMLG
jgi:hypothetical protein